MNDSDMNDRGRQDGDAREHCTAGDFVEEPREPGKLRVRWMIRRDMPETLAIERDRFEFPWSEDEFVRCLRRRNCIGMVADQDDEVVGFMVYELHKTRLHVLNFAVSRQHCRKGIGRRMVDKLVGKLSEQRRSRIVLEVRETNLAAQLFFRALGFRAVNVFKDFYDDTSEDAYLFQYRYCYQQLARSAA